MSNNVVTLMIHIISSTLNSLEYIKAYKSTRKFAVKKNEMNGLLCPHLDLALNKEYTNSLFFKRKKTKPNQRDTVMIYLLKL